MTNKEIVKAIIEKIEELDTDVYFGIRSLTDDESYEIGEVVRNSYEWDVENDCSTYFTTGEETDGACATGDLVDKWSDEEEIENQVAAWIEANYWYEGDKQVLVFGTEEGTYITRDDQEVRIVDAQVLMYI